VISNCRGRTFLEGEICCRFKVSKPMAEKATLLKTKRGTTRKIGIRRRKVKRGRARSGNLLRGRPSYDEGRSPVRRRSNTIGGCITRREGEGLA